MRKVEKEMRKILSCAMTLSLFTGGTAFASGYQLPDLSMNSTSKAGANIASANSADAAYTNPAAVSWLKDGWLAEVGTTYIHLTAVKYQDDYNPVNNGKSKVEDAIVPDIFIVSPEWRNMRFGFSITAPSGLAKRWNQPYPATFASKFALSVIDFNPTVTYAITDKLSVAGGLRFLYASAMIMSNGMIMSEGPIDINASRTLDAEAYGYGYNLAIDYKASKEWNFAATYRSQVNLNFKGDSTLTSDVLESGQPLPSTMFGALGLPDGMRAAIDTKGRVTAINPAVLALSTAYSWDKFTIELTVDRTFWSGYNQLNFNYDQSLAAYPVLAEVFGPVEKNYKDSNAIRLGLEYKITQPLTLMAGIAYDENPAPEGTMGFELPSSDAFQFSIGARYAVTDRLDVGVGALADVFQNFSVHQQDGAQINGRFSDATALLVTLGIQYRF